MSKHRFIASAAGISREMSPLGTNGAKLRREREGENIFYRWKFAGTLTFAKEDFHWLRALEIGGYRCEAVTITVELECAGVWRELGRFSYSLTDAKVDLKACLIELSTSVPADAYKTVFDGYGKEYNVLEVPASAANNVTAKFDFDADFEFLRIDNKQFNAEQVEEFDTWASFLETSYWIEGTLFKAGLRSPLQVLYRLVKFAPYTNGAPTDLSGDGWQIIQDRIFQNGQLAAYYAKKPDLYSFRPYQYTRKGDFDKYPDLIQIPCGEAYDQEKYIAVTGTGGAFNAECGTCLNIRTDANDNRCRQLLWEFGKFTFNRNRQLLDALYFLIQKSCPQVLPATPAALSVFFTTDINYSTQQENVVKDLLLAAKSDIIGYNSSEGATKAMLSLSKLLTELRHQFQVYWFLDGAGKFRLEHYAFFEQAGVVDFTTVERARWMNASYTYDKPNMPQFERLRFASSFGIDFELGEIEYEGACVNTQEGQNTKESSVSLFDNDLENLLVQGESLNRTGFVLIAHRQGLVVSEFGEVSDQLIVNGHLAAANLVKHYWQHGRVKLTGLVNQKPANFISAIPIVKQEPFTVQKCCELEVYAFSAFMTSLSSIGKLDYEEYELKNSARKFSILHPADESQGNLPRAFDDSFGEEFG